jgi:chromosome segregation ATPase
LPAVVLRLHTWSLVALLAVGASACAAEDDDQAAELAAVRAELTDRAEREQALADRLDELEEELAALGADVTTSTRLDELEDRLGQVDGEVAVLADGLEEERDAREAAAQQADDAASDLRASLASLQGAVDELRGEVDELRVLYETLRDRLDRQQRG